MKASKRTINETKSEKISSSLQKEHDILCRGYNILPYRRPATISMDSLLSLNKDCSSQRCAALLREWTSGLEADESRALRAQQQLIRDLRCGGYAIIAATDSDQVIIKVTVFLLAHALLLLLSKLTLRG